MSPGQAAGIAGSLLFAALFSCLEIAFIASNKLHIHFLEQKGIFSGRMLYRFVKNPSAFVGTTLIGYVLAMVTYGLLAAGAAYPWLLSLLPEAWQMPMLSLPLLALLLFFPFLLVAEFLPKLVFLVNPDAFLQVLSLPVRLLHYALYPLIAGMSSLSRWVVTHLLRIPRPPSEAVFNLTDLNEYLARLARRDQGKEEPEVNPEIFNNALRFKTVRVRDCMVPRTEITAVEVRARMSELRQAFLQSGHSKVIVYKDNIDNIIGYCHALDLFKKPKDIQSLIEPIPVVSESTAISELLVKFTSGQKTLALVVDEFGGTSGLVSLEDVMEQIFGEIQDEYDQSEDWVEEKLDDHTYLLGARHEINYLNRKYNLGLPKGEYETLGGLIFAELEAVPRVNEQIVSGRFVFTVLSVQNARIDVVKLTIARFPHSDRET